jgi:hypothetical protein
LVPLYQKKNVKSWGRQTSGGSRAWLEIRVSSTWADKWEIKAFMQYLATALHEGMQTG